jgi:Putative prokaryotic signal transducing protein
VDLVRLTTAQNEIEAEQVRALLRLEGIESMQRLTNFGAGSMDGSSGMGGPREILVQEQDLKAARALISEETD